MPAFIGSALATTSLLRQTGPFRAIDVDDLAETGDEASRSGLDERDVAVECPQGSASLRPSFSRSSQDGQP